MRRKIIIFLVALVSVICLTGCGKKKVGTSHNSNIGSVNEKPQSEEMTNSFQQFEADVEKGILYGNDMGQISDSLGNPIEGYSYLKIVDGENISDGQTIVEGYIVGNTGKIINCFIRSGEAQDDNDWTGVYKDTSSEGSGEEIVIVQDGNTATYEFEDTKEINCKIDGDYLSGTLWYISRNSDGTLSISSGSGGSWGHFEKIEKYAKIDVTDPEKVIDASAGYSEDDSYDSDNVSLSDYTEVTLLDLNRNGEDYIGMKIAVMGTAVYSVYNKTLIQDNDFNTIYCDDIKAINTDGEEVGHLVSEDQCEVFGTLIYDDHGGVGGDDFGELRIQTDTIVILSE